jgi:hypothetical protein
MKQCYKGSLLRIKSGDVLPDSDDGLLHRILGGIIGSSWTLDGAFMSPAGKAMKMIAKFSGEEPPRRNRPPSDSVFDESPG